MQNSIESKPAGSAKSRRKPSRRGAIGALVSLSAIDGLTEKQATDRIRVVHRMATRLIRWLLLTVVAAVVVLALFGLSGHPSVGLYRTLVVVIGLFGCGLALIASPLLVALQFLKERNPEAVLPLERSVRTTAGIACIAVVGASLSLFAPIDPRWGLPVLTVFVLPTTVLGVLLGWIAVPTRIMEKLVLVPLALYLGVLSAMLLPQSAKFLDEQYSNLDRRVQAWLFGQVKTDPLQQIDSAEFCKQPYYFDGLGTALVYYCEDSPGEFKLFSGPGIEPGGRVVLPVNREGSSEKPPCPACERIDAWCKKLLAPPPPPPTTVEPPSPPAPPLEPPYDLLVVCVEDVDGKSDLSDLGWSRVTEQVRTLGRSHSIAPHDTTPELHHAALLNDQMGIAKAAATTAKFVYVIKLKAEVGPPTIRPGNAGGQIEHFLPNMSLTASLLDTATGGLECSFHYEPEDRSKYAYINGPFSGRHFVTLINEAWPTAKGKCPALLDLAN